METSVFRSEQEEEIYRDALAFAREVILPVAAEVDQTATIPDWLFEAMGEKGYFGRLIPREYGGLGGTISELCAQELGLAYGSMAVASTAMASSLCSWPLLTFGSDAQKRQFLPGMARGEIVGTIGITEPGHGSDVANLETSAVRNAAGGWTLNGKKWLIDNTRYGDFFLCWARSGPKAEDAPHKGISTFLVERSRPGWREAEVYDLLGLRGLGVGGFALEDVELPPENLIGPEGAGFYHIMAMLDFGRTATAAIMLGGAQAAIDLAKGYATSRIQFGVPLAKHQALSFKIAEMATRHDACHLMMWRTARLLDGGKRAGREASMTKWFSAESCMQIAHEALQIHGGIGCIKKSPVERIFRDMRIFSIGEGSTEVQKIITARHELENVPPLEVLLPEQAFEPERAAVAAVSGRR